MADPSVGQLFFYGFANLVHTGDVIDYHVGREGVFSGADGLDVDVMHAAHTFAFADGFLYLVRVNSFRHGVYAKTQAL